MRKPVGFLVLFVLVLSLVATGCSSTQELWESDQAEQVSETASTEAAVQISDFIEGWLGWEVPEVVQKQIAGIITSVLDPLIEDLLEKADKRKASGGP